MDTAWVATEMEGATLKDRRQIRSLVRITAALAADTDLSLTAACGPGLRQAAHRLFEHPMTTVDHLLAGHFAETARRCAEFPVVLVAQDTTFFTYAQSQIEGLGQINGKGKTGALLGHSALALTEAGTPLGLLSLQLWGASDGSAPYPHPKESAKWEEALRDVATHLPAPVRAVVIQDREADFYAFLAAPRRDGLDLLVRASQDRLVELTLGEEASAVEASVAVPASGAETLEPAGAAEDERLRLFAAAAQAPVLGEWSVVVPCDSKNSHQILPRQRQAVLEIRATPVRVRRPGAAAAEAAELLIWLVSATEVAPPEGEKAVRWTLLTTLPAADLEDACRIVGYYAKRWLIERLHFTLKSGLRAERLQIDDARSLAHCLGVYYVVAWRLLHLTYVAREDPDRPADEILAPDELTVLRAATKKRVHTLAEAVREIATLGGYQYYRKALPPGVKSLWLGWKRLTGMVEGWRLAQEQFSGRTYDA